MAMLDAMLEKFDASKAKVRQEIREGFFDAEGGLRISEQELRTWIADRAVDEMKVVLQLSDVLSKCAHLLPAHILVQVTEQMSDEARHFDILRSIVPAELQKAVDDKAAALPGVLAADRHWQSLRSASEQGNPVSALLDINIVHEGYSAAAIEELKGIPFEDVREAYAGIGADEEKHHESGRELLLWLSGAADAQAAETGGELVDLSAQVVEAAHTRADSGGTMEWQWPSPAPFRELENAHERADSGGTMEWQWPTS